MKKILKISVVIVLAAGIAALALYFYGAYRNRPVQGITVRIFRENPQKGFLSANRILNLIDKDSAITGKRVKDVDLKQIDRKLENNPWIDKRDIFFNIEGRLMVHVKERKPVVRVYDKKGNSFYIDEKGYLFPPASNYAPNLLIANGYIPVTETGINIHDSAFHNSVVRDIYNLALLIGKDPFLKSNISEIYRNSKKQYDLIPEVGKQIIRFGSMEHASVKLRNLKAFYKKAYLKYGGNQYSEINLRYINQIVCTKK